MAVIVSTSPPFVRAVVGNELFALENTIEMKTQDYLFFFTLYGSFLIIILGSSFFRDVQVIPDNPLQIIDALGNEVRGVGFFFFFFRRSFW